MTFVHQWRAACSRGIVVTGLLFSPITFAQTPDLTYFTGTTKLACEALLCLSSGVGAATGACSPGLSHYFDIKKRNWSDTMSARLNFLNQCPDAQKTSEMSTLVDAISKGAGRCDAETLNSELGSVRTDANGAERGKISNVLPGYCYAYAQHHYTDLDGTLPRYVGEPGMGGRWVDPKHYEAWIKNQQGHLQ